jgi:hypothetical protein
MALDMWLYIVDDTTIQKLSEAPHLLDEFLEDKPAVPGPNHRNVDMFHFILSGTEGPVSGIKGLFHGFDDAIPIGEESAAALTSETTRQLLKALRKLDETTIRKRWSQLIRRRGLVKDENEPGLDEAEKKRRTARRAEEEADPYFHQSFAGLTQLCEQAVGQNQGLLWSWG